MTAKATIVNISDRGETFMVFNKTLKPGERAIVAVCPTVVVHGVQAPGGRPGSQEFAVTVESVGKTSLSADEFEKLMARNRKRSAETDE